MELKVAFRTRNTIKHHIGMIEKTNDIYSLSGIYQMDCKDYPLKYTEQTGRAFRTRYKEHIIEIQTNGRTSNYAQHILNTTHNYDR
jgi:hypothetical protein